MYLVIVRQFLFILIATATFYDNTLSPHSDSTHFRSYNRYAHDPLDYGSRFPPSSGGLHPKLKPDPRNKRLYSPMANHHSNYRAPYHQMSYSRMDSSNEGSLDEEIRAKRPCLSVDVSRRSSDPPNSADSVASSNHVGGSPPTVTKVSVSCEISINGCLCY